MDGREGMAFSGSASYYLNRGGISGAGSASGSGGGAGGGSGVQLPTGVPTPPGYKSFSNPNISIQSNVGGGGGGGGGAPMGGGSTFQVGNNPSPSFAHGISISPSMPSSGDPGKKKRGRPRKYAPDGSNMSLGLSPMSSMPSPGSNTPGGGPKKGRPPGSGWKQRLAPLGEWMNATAGLAFTPHVIHVEIGEDVAAKILSFAQQRPRALCILSANGSVSALTLRQPTTTGETVTYEGRFEILCLSGSYLLAETGGPKSRTGGISISVCSPDGHVIGGAIGGRLIASSSVQVVVCSFVYGSTKAKDKAETSKIKEEKTSTPKSAKKLADQKPLITTPVSAAASQDHPTPHSATSSWPPPPSRTDMRNPQTEIDLTRG